MGRKSIEQLVQFSVVSSLPTQLSWSLILILTSSARLARQCGLAQPVDGLAQLHEAGSSCW